MRSTAHKIGPKTLLWYGLYEEDERPILHPPWTLAGDVIVTRCDVFDERPDSLR